MKIFSPFLNYDNNIQKSILITTQSIRLQIIFRGELDSRYIKSEVAESANKAKILWLQFRNTVTFLNFVLEKYNAIFLTNASLISKKDVTKTRERQVCYSHIRIQI